MEKVSVQRGDIEGLLVFNCKIFEDVRGSFSETFNRDNFEKLGFQQQFVQDNISHSNKNVVRGLHYQWDGAMGKLIQAVKGSILDVAVDIRSGSPTFGRYQSVVLSENNGKVFWVPPGFAHGFLSLDHGSIVHYKCTATYRSKSESGINPLDSTINVDWGVDASGLIISEKDSQLQSIEDYSKHSKFSYN